MCVRSWALGVMMMVVLTSGCASNRQQDGMTAADREYVPPTSIYNVLDSTALVYSDPAAAAAVNDSPFRWLGFLMHPIGQALDYVINRPLYTLASWFPNFFGYTAEDSMLDAQRR